jgi:hypothetical protein
MQITTIYDIFDEEDTRALPRIDTQWITESEILTLPRFDSLSDAELVSRLFELQLMHRDGELTDLQEFVMGLLADQLDRR